MATNDYAITNTLLQSLFGPSPEQQAQAYQQARDQQALQMAQLTPGRGAVFAGSQLAQDLGQSAQQLGGAVRRGVFGIETPKEIEDNVANQIKAKAQPLLQQGDMAAYADFLAQEYSKAGLTDRALRAKTAGDQFRMKQAELAKVRSEETKNLAAAAKDNQERKQLVKTPEGFARAANELGFGVRPNLADYSQEETRLVNKLLEDRGLQKARAGASPGQKSILKVDEDKAKDYSQVETSALRSLSSLSRMKEVYGKGITAGTLSEARNSFLTALDSIGLSTAKARSVIANNEQFQKETEALIQQIIKQYGYNPSNVDVIRAAKSVPSLANSPEGLGKLLDSMIKIKNDEYQEANRALEYYRDNEGSFKGFKPKMPVMPSPKTGLEDLTDDELLARLRSAK